MRIHHFTSNKARKARKAQKADESHKDNEANEAQENSESYQQTCPVPIESMDRQPLEDPSDNLIERVLEEAAEAREALWQSAKSLPMNDPKTLAKGMRLTSLQAWYQVINGF